MVGKFKTIGKTLYEIFNVILIALFIAVILRVFFIESALIVSSSMENTLKIGDQVLVWKFLYNKKIPLIKYKFFIGIPIHRKDIIIFKYQDGDNYVKRVIGLPGDKILLKNNKVFVNGKLLNEPYVKSNKNVRYINSVYEVPNGKLFVMGDNRNNSSDSREFGFVDMNDVIGKVILVYYPFNRIRFY